MPKDRSHKVNYVGLEVVADEVTTSTLNGPLAGVTTFTDNTGGTPSSTLAAITAGGTYAQADLVAIKNALASISATLNTIIGKMD